MNDVEDDVMDVMLIKMSNGTFYIGKVCLEGDSRFIKTLHLMQLFRYDREESDELPPLFISPCNFPYDENSNVLVNFSHIETIFHPNYELFMAYNNLIDTLQGDKYETGLDE